MATLQSGKCFTVPTFFGMCCKSEWQERMYIYKWHEVDQTKHEIFCSYCLQWNTIQSKFRNHYFLFLFAFSILSQLFLIWGCTFGCLSFILLFPCSCIHSLFCPFPWACLFMSVFHLFSFCFLSSFCLFILFAFLFCLSFFCLFFILFFFLLFFWFIFILAHPLFIFLSCVSSFFLSWLFYSFVLSFVYSGV